MRRSSPPRRSARPKRSTRPKARNVKRRSAEWTRAYHSPEFVAWIREQPSVASGKGPCVAAHSVTGGMGRKADAMTIVPLTDAEHREIHQHGIKTFEATHGVSLSFHAPRIWARFLREHGE